MRYRICIFPILIILLIAGCNKTSNDNYLSEIKLREEPLRYFQVRDTINVSDFGAIPDDKFIDTDAIQRAIDSAAKMNSKVLIFFEKGVYRLDAFNRRHALEINRASDLIFDGYGATFLMVRPEILFMPVIDSKRIILRNFEVDYEISPFTQGWVSEVNPEEKWLKVKIDSGWPDPGNDNFRNAHYKWAFIKDKNNLPAFKEGTEFRLYLNDWEKLEDNTWIYHTRYTSKLKTIEVGDPFVQISRVDGCLISAIQF